MNYQAIAGHADHINARAAHELEEAAVRACRIEDEAERTYELSDALVMCDMPLMRFWLARENYIRAGEMLVNAKRTVLAKRHAEIEKQETEQARREGVFHG